MPRSNRPGGRKNGSGGEDEVFDLSHIMAGWRRTEQRRGATWNVQPISAVQAVKSYVCPGCGLEVLPGTAHLVTWRADGVMGDSADIAARRHWHTRCWKIS
jgi:hypothetical protein